MVIKTIFIFLLTDHYPESKVKTKRKGSYDLNMEKEKCPDNE